MDEPLRLRIISVSPSKHFHSPPGNMATANRYGHYKLWSEDQMSRALDAVEKQGVTITQAAAEYRVPQSTLGDRIRHRVKPGAKSGPSKYLNDAEEKELVDFLLRCCSIGYPRTRKQVIAIVQRWLDSRGAKHTVTDGWWTSFSRRHPQLSLRNPGPLSRSRAIASNPETINSYFDLLEQTLDTYNLQDHPELIFNMDESGIPLNPKPPKVVAHIKARSVTSISSEGKSQITCVGCVSASGFCLPPMIIWDRQTMSTVLAEGEVRGTIYGLSPRGWMDAELFDGWFCNHFLKHAPRDRPLLLLLGGHSSHFCPETLVKAAKQDVIVFALPPNTTHLSQPLDKGCFGPLKTKWKEVCHNYVSENPGKVVTRYTFSKLFAHAWMSSMTMRNIISGFETTGIFPVNRDALLKKLADEDKDDSKSERNHLPFLPMSSPLPPMRKPKPKAANSVTFTVEEIEKFQRRFENGYDIVTDERYNQWLVQNYPAETTSLLDASLSRHDEHYGTLDASLSLRTGQRCALDVSVSRHTAQHGCRRCLCISTRCPAWSP